MHQPTFAIHIYYDMMIIDEWRWKLALFLWVLMPLCAATCQHYRSSGISSTLCLISNTDKTWNLCDVIKNLLYSLLCCGYDDAQAFHNFRICLRMLCLVWGQWMWVETNWNSTFTAIMFTKHFQLICQNILNTQWWSMLGTPLGSGWQFENGFLWTHERAETFRNSSMCFSLWQRVEKWWKEKAW